MPDMRINRKLNLDSILALVLMLLVVAACTRTRKSEPSANSGRSDSNESAASNEMTAEALFDEYQKDKAAADRKYKDQELVVTGTVDIVKIGVTGNPYVTMNTSSLILRVQFLFDKKHVSALSQLRKGQKATIKGRVYGRIGNVMLKDCELL
jgi:hypothetical protein